MQSFYVLAGENQYIKSHNLPMSGNVDYWEISNVVSVEKISYDMGGIITQVDMVYAEQGCRATMLVDFEAGDYPYLGKYIGATDDVYTDAHDSAPMKEVSNLTYGDGCIEAGSYYELPEGIWYFGCAEESESFFVTVLGNDKDTWYTISMGDMVIKVSEPKIYESSYTFGRGSDSTDAVFYTARVFYVKQGTQIVLPGNETDIYEIAVAGGWDRDYQDFSNYEVITLSGGKIISPNMFDFKVTLFSVRNEQRPDINFDFSFVEYAFDDISENDYYFNPILWGISEGITTGTSANTFSPNDTCSQAQILTFLWRANGEPIPTIENPFSDTNLSKDDYYYNAVLWAYEQGVITDNKLNFNEGCSRSNVVLYLWRLSGSENFDDSHFIDVMPNTDYSKAVSWAVANNITSGTSEKTFSPDMLCTRGQIMTFLYRYFA